MKRIVLVGLLASLTACGGGGGSSAPTTATSASPSNTPKPGTASTTLEQVTNAALTNTVTSTNPAVTVDPIVQALKLGSVKSLSAADRPQLLNLATQLASRYQQNQSAALADIYADSSLNLTLNHTSNSSEINIGTRTVATPFITADDGSGMAAIAQFGTGRGLAYGKDILSWIANQSQETQHTALFSRAFNWVLTGKAAGPLPATVKYATAGYDAATVGKLMTRFGKTGQAVSCDLVLATNTCWQEADVLVFGAGVKDDAALTEQIRKYLSNGKAVIYMHGSWGDSGGGRKVLDGMGMRLGDYPGNYFAAAAGVSVGASRTIAENLKRSDQMSALVQTLSLLAQDKPALQLSVDASAAVPITQINNELATMQGNGIDIFNNPTTDLYRLLVL